MNLNENEKIAFEIRLEAIDKMIPDLERSVKKQKLNLDLEFIKCKVRIMSSLVRLHAFIVMIGALYMYYDRIKTGNLFHGVDLISIALNFLISTAITIFLIFFVFDSSNFEGSNGIIATSNESRSWFLYAGLCILVFISRFNSLKNHIEINPLIQCIWMSFFFYLYTLIGINNFKYSKLINS